MNLPKIKELIDDMMELRDFYTEIGDVMKLDDFVEYTKDHFIMDYDGYGDVLYKGQEIFNSFVWADEQLIVFTDYGTDNIIAFSLFLIKEIYGDDIKICWYNK